ncbi:CHAT domain-containing protein [Aquimarina sp. MAR_2010_214]|uniref:CHAT domain-containing protein n=1 Tax=Aquimarina sp. MAR_2010_214 TaxID=1250026 RepID=UPI000C715A51|nr:tetratricopeptide repeat protein [Aquimarina sp. MAR_2010_214]PKV48484.1 CHAT domain-containing protein [Aquimarina sp. MAR_2010_214]
MKKLASIFLTSFFCVILFMLSLHTTHAQVTNDTIVASQYYKKADSLLKDRKYEKSIELFQKALPIYKKGKTWEKVASCYNKISENQWRNRQNLKESLSSAKKVLKMSRTILGENNRERAVAYDNIGTYYLRISKYQDALVNYEKSLDIEKKIFPKGHEDMGATYSNLGIACRYLSKYQKAIYYQNKALSIYFKNSEPNDERIGKEYNNIGNIYSRMGKYNTALDYYKKNLTITINNLGENHLNSGYNYFNIGIVYNDLNQYDKALEYYQKVIPIFGNEENLYPLFATYNNIGTLLSDKGEHDKAMEYNKKSLDMALKIYEGDHPDIGTCYWNIGVVFENKQSYENALQYYNKALSIYKTTYGENYEGIAALYGNIGNVYAHKKDFSKALEYHQKGLLVYNNILEKNDYEVSKAYINVANLYLEKGVYKEAFRYSQKSLEILEEEYGKGSSSSLLALNQIATVCSKQKAYQKAIEYFDNATEANTKNTNYLDIKQDFNPNQYYNTKFLLETLKGKAKTLQSQYFQTNNILDLDHSIIIYKEADMLINHIRQSFQNYQDKISFAKQAKEIYADAIQTQLLLYKNKQDQQSLKQAFYYAEKSKSNTLKELLNTSTAKNFTGLPQDVLTLEKVIKTNKAFYQSRITEEQLEKEVDTSKVTHYESKLFDINRTQDSLTQVLEKNYPKYYQLKYKNDIVKVSDIQQQLDDKATVVEFFTGDSITYAFTISKHDIAVQELSTPKLTEQIETFRKSIIAKNTGAYKQQAYALYNTLIAPVKDKLVGDQLIMIPDGPLWHLNFELLLTIKDDSNNPTLLSYLLRDYAVTYANAANLLFTTFKSNRETKPLQECLAFSFSDSIQTAETRAMSMATLRDVGDDLPGTRKEIKAISDIIDGQYYFGSQAIEANFKSNAGQYNILHLALHGEVDNERPDNSKLYFTKSKDTIEDNLLYSHELFALDIPAELTVLSACNTGSGKIAKGEGIMSLGTAFQYAGTKSLLLTSWEVSDQTTPELMKYFYTNLKGGMHKGKALQQAKLQYLTTADINRTDPFYWGGFYLVGDTTAIHFSNDTQLYWILGLGIVGIMLLVVFLYRKRTNNT